MIDFAQVQNKKFAVIFVENDGTEDGKWTFLVGVAKWRDGHLFVFLAVWMFQSFRFRMIRLTE